MSSNSPARGDALRNCFIIGLVSAAVLLYEIAITRILSVVLWYHFAFLSVSLAMLGLGAPGVWFALRAPRERALPRALLMAGLLVPASVIALFAFGNRVPHRPAFATLCILAPMLALGSAICVLLVKARGRQIGRLYGADLIGATVGALSVVPLLHILPTPIVVAGAGLLPLLGLLLVPGERRWPAIAAIAVILAGLFWREPFTLRYAKYYDEPPDILFEQWTPTARLTVFPNVFFVPNPSEAFGWGMGTRYRPRLVEQLWLEQDGSAGTPITRFAGSFSSLDHLLFDVTSVGYQIKPAPRVCVIGAGGGRDILTALAAGAREIDAVEFNPQIVDLVSRTFGDYSGDIYHAPGVRAVVSEGRSFLTTTPARYDLLQISLIDSWAATAAGAFALSENYLYTVEAYRLYWNRLTPEGMISTSRWILGTHQLETVRLVHLVEEALRLEGVADPKAHYAVVQGGMIATLLISRRPFSGSLLQDLTTTVADRGFTLHWPFAAAPLSEYELAAVLQLGPHSLSRYGINLTPPVDDKPFFFQTVDLFSKTDAEVLRKLSVNEQAVVLLRQLLLVVCALALLLFFLPFALGRRIPKEEGFWRGTFFFFSIGLAFMLVEIPVIQKTILYLGHPSHATTIVLASMLLGASLGAFTSGRTEIRTIRRWGAPGIVVLLAAALILGDLFRATLGWPFPARAFLTFVVVGTMGFFMGFPFPAGMVRFGEKGKPWFWAVNGAVSVTASVLSLALSMRLGFTAVAVAGVCAYIPALWLLGGGGRKSASLADDQLPG